MSGVGKKRPHPVRQPPRRLRRSARARGLAPLTRAAVRRAACLPQADEGEEPNEMVKQLAAAVVAFKHARTRPPRCARSLSCAS